MNLDPTARRESEARLRAERVLDAVLAWCATEGRPRDRAAALDDLTNAYGWSTDGYEAAWALDMMESSPAWFPDAALVAILDAGGTP